MHVPISALLAMTPSGGIGNAGTLPWLAAGINLSGDLKYFKHHTSITVNPSLQNAVIMGRRTWEGIPNKHRPLPGRCNIVLTSDTQWASSNLPYGVWSASSFEAALSLLQENDSLKGNIERACVIGGSRLFEQAIFHPHCDVFHVTRYTILI